MNAQTASLSDRMDAKISGLDYRVSNLSDSMGNGFKLIDERLGKVEQRLADVVTSQRDVSKRLERVESTTVALHNDVVELYGMV